MSCCELRLEIGLAGSFVQAMQRTLSGAGYAKVLEYTNPAGPDLMEFRHNQRVIMVEIVDEGEVHQVVRVQSDDFDCQPLIRQSAIDCATAVTVDLLAPLSDLSPSELKSRVETALTSLATSLTRPACCD